MIKERTKHARLKTVALLAICLISMFVFAGCVERRLTVKSNPPGANVYFNHKLVGQTPVNFDFKWYWTYKVELQKSGYKTISKFETIKAPPYMWIPFDLVTEILPFKVRDYHNLTYNLEPQKEKEKEKQEETKNNIKNVKPNK